MNLEKLLNEYNCIKDFENDILSGNPLLDNNSIRILHYKLKFILKEESLRNLSTWNSKIVNIRKKLYYERVKNFRIPYHDLPEKSEYYKPNIAPAEKQQFKKKNLLSQAVSVSDPLSLDNLKYSENLAGAVDELEELKIIILDIDRTFPTILYFRDIKIRKQLIEILFLWYKTNNFGYKQGFHEILAMIFLIVADKVDFLKDNQTENNVGPNNRDLETCNTYPEFKQIFNSNEIVCDAFLIFSEFIKQPILEYYVEATLVLNCKTFDLLLEQFDKELYHNLVIEIGLENQIWLIRYYKLLLMRELPLNLVLSVWDRLICFQDYNIFMSCIILDLLLKIKKKILIFDSDSVLKILLNYSNNTKLVINDEFFNDVLLTYNAINNNNLNEIGNMLNLKSNNCELVCKQGCSINDFLHKLRLNEKLRRIVKKQLN